MTICRWQTEGSDQCLDEATGEIVVAVADGRGGMAYNLLVPLCDEHRAFLRTDTRQFSLKRESAP